MTFLDTSAMISSFSGDKQSAKKLRLLIETRERILVPSLVLYEWLRGPRTLEELAAQEALFPSELAVVFGPAEAAVSAELYRKLKRPRGREVDLAIAACAIVKQARLWTLNTKDFSDVPHLQLVP